MKPGCEVLCPYAPESGSRLQELELGGADLARVVLRVYIAQRIGQRIGL